MLDSCFLQIRRRGGGGRQRRRRKSNFADSICSEEYVFQFSAKSDNIYYVFPQNSQKHSLIPPPWKVPFQKNIKNTYHPMIGLIWRFWLRLHSASGFWQSHQSLLCIRVWRTRTCSVEKSCTRSDCSSLQPKINYSFHHFLYPMYWLIHYLFAKLKILCTIP